MFSIIMPTYNRGYIISRAINSVLEQTYQDFELIIVDDGSDDNTKEVIEAFENTKIKYYLLNHKGANHARNYGMKFAKGEYFAFLDSDNAWLPDYLQQRSSMFMKYGIDFIFGQYYIDDNLSNICPDFKEEELNTWDKLMRVLLQKNVIDTNTVCMKRTCWEQEGGFDEEINRLQDWDYYFKIISSRKYTYKYSIDANVRYFRMKDSITNNREYEEAYFCIAKKRLTWIRQYHLVYEVFYPIFRYVADKNRNEINHMAYGILELLELEEILELLYKVAKNEKLILALNMQLQSVIKKNELIMQLQERWIDKLQNGEELKDYFVKHNIKSVVIYGYGKLGKALYRECNRYNDIKIQCVVDKKVQSKEASLKIVNNPEEIANMNIDCIVVTAVSDFELIKEELQKYTNAGIVSIEEVIMF